MSLSTVPVLFVPVDDVVVDAGNDTKVSNTDDSTSIITAVITNALDINLRWVIYI